MQIMPPGLCKYLKTFPKGFLTKMMMMINVTGIALLFYALLFWFLSEMRSERWHKHKRVPTLTVIFRCRHKKLLTDGKNKKKTTRMTIIRTKSCTYKALHGHVHMKTSSIYHKTIHDIFAYVYNVYIYTPYTHDSLAYHSPGPSVVFVAVT